MTRSAPARKLSVGARIGLVIGVLLGGGLVYLGGVSVASELRLRNTGAAVEADVLDTRIMRSNRTGDSFEVLYQFHVPGAAQTYGHGDETGREGLWASLPEPTWLAAKSSKKVAVNYLPGDPRVNRPVHAGAAPLGDSIAGLALGLMIALPCLLVLVLWGRRPRLTASGGP